LSNLT